MEGLVHIKRTAHEKGLQERSPYATFKELKVSMVEAHSSRVDQQFQKLEKW